ncbi:MAG: GMC oxidoreductase, partial [Patescibacteria group bacterium]
MRQTSAWQDGMVIEEGSLPGALAKMLPAFLAGAAKASGDTIDSSFGDKLRQKARELESLARGAYHGAMQNTQTFLVMAHDDSNGTIELEDDRPRIRWPAVGTQKVFDRINKALSEATAPLGGTYVKNPMWADWLGNRLITVHPLGGCAMADRAEEGVVDHRGRVFSGTQGSEVYAGLLVGDGAIMPRSLGVNPLLTISAL